MEKATKKERNLQRIDAERDNLRAMQAEVTNAQKAVSRLMAPQVYKNEKFSITRSCVFARYRQS